MQCEYCGATLTNKIFQINNVTLCERCAKLTMSDPRKDFGGIFGGGMLEEITSLMSSQIPGIDFANKRITCPRCHSTLRDIETTGRVGCIECYNTFNETIIKTILKTQGNGEYCGRKPGEQKDITPNVDVAELTKDSKPAGVDAVSTEPTEIKVEEPSKTAETKAESNVTTETMYMRLKGMEDLSIVAEADLKKAMSEAVAIEDYQAAVRFRDELKKRGDK